MFIKTDWLISSDKSINNKLIVWARFRHRSTYSVAVTFVHTCIKCILFVRNGFIKKPNRTNNWEEAENKAKQKYFRLAFGEWNMRVRVWVADISLCGYDYEHFYVRMSSRHEATTEKRPRYDSNTQIFRVRLWRAFFGGPSFGAGCTRRLPSILCISAFRHYY